jgi:hypothetical protein
MKQTAVEYLIDKFDTILPLDFNWDKLEKVFEQAKAMEKEQMADKWQEGYDACEFHIFHYENLQTKTINNPYK